mmetsp:Transcript_44902/g.81950  ORF Transcript_44902/g.81950 Transcript_44902/m.81950 type:complete len:496 (-) Transcript_44902:101-1588(-)
MQAMDAFTSDNLASFRSLENFTQGESLGVGSFCEVVQCTDKITNRQYAMKRVPKRMSSIDQACAMEAHCLRQLEQSECIVQLYWEFDTAVEWVAVLEWCEGGELWAAVRHCGCCLEEESSWYVWQMVEALATCHSAGIVHRDVKCENFLLTKSRKLRLIDFGTARDTRHPEVEPMMIKPMYEHHVGTPNFMAPEAVNGKANDACSDLWSLGCSIYQLLLGVPPFNSPTPFLIMEKVIAGQLWLPEHGLKAEERSLIEQLVQVEPLARIGAQDGQTRRLLHHALLKHHPDEPPAESAVSKALALVSRAALAEAESAAAAEDGGTGNAEEDGFAIFGQPHVPRAAPGEALRGLPDQIENILSSGGDMGSTAVKQVLLSITQEAAARAVSAGKPEEFGAFVSELADVEVTSLPVFVHSLLKRSAEIAEQLRREAKEQASLGGNDDDEQEESLEDSESEADPEAGGTQPSQPRVEGSMAVGAGGGPAGPQKGCCPRRRR